jgi:hypothetical protein
MALSPMIGERFFVHPKRKVRNRPWALLASAKSAAVSDARRKWLEAVNDNGVTGADPALPSEKYGGISGHPLNSDRRRIRD